MTPTSRSISKASSAFRIGCGCRGTGDPFDPQLDARMIIQIRNSGSQAAEIPPENSQVRVLAYTPKWIIWQFGATLWYVFEEVGSARLPSQIPAGAAVRVAIDLPAGTIPEHLSVFVGHPPVPPATLTSLFEISTPLAEGERHTNNSRTWEHVPTTTPWP